MASRKPLLIAFAAAVGLFPLPSLSAVWTSLDGSKALVRNSSGAVVRLQVASVLPSVAAGGGAASLKASQALVIGNAVANLELTRNVPVANLAKVARVAARAIGPLALAGLVYEGVQWVNDEWLTEASEDYEIPSSISPNRSWIQQQSSGYPCFAYAEKCGFSAAVDAVLAAHEANPFQLDMRVESIAWPSSCSNPAAVCTVVVTSSYFHSSQPTGPTRYTRTDSLTGYGTEGPSVVQAGPATDSQLESAFQQGLIASPSLAGQVLDASVASSAALAEVAADPLAVTGPASVDGGTTTSTRVDTAGTTTTQIQTTYNLSYQGDTVNLTQTQVETVTDPANNVTTTTTTTDTPTGDPPPPEEPPDLCADNPDASGCAPFGTPEPPTPLPEEDRTVSVAPEMSAAGACPAPQAFSIAGQSFQLTYDGACEFAQGIRPVVLAVAWMGAFVFLFSIGRAQTS